MVKGSLNVLVLVRGVRLKRGGDSESLWVVVGCRF